MSAVAILGEATYNIVVCIDCGFDVRCFESKVEVNQDAPFTLRRTILPEEHVLSRDVPVKYPNVIGDKALMAWSIHKLGRSNLLRYEVYIPAIASRIADNS